MSKTSFARTQDQKNFVGKLIFPFHEDIQEFFFHNSGKVYKINMYWKGKLLDSVELTSKQIELFESIGYTFEKIELNQSKKTSNKKFENIPIYAKVIDSEIEVSYHAKDLIEVTSRGKFILNKIYEFTGIKGHGNVLRKMERC